MTPNDVFIYCTYCISTLPEISFLKNKNHPLSFSKRPTFWDQAGKFMAFSFLWQARPSMVVRQLPRSTLEQKWEKHQQRHEGDDTKETGWKWGALLQQKSTGNGTFFTKWGDFLLFFWFQLIYFSYSYKLPVELWRIFWATFDINAAIHMGL